MNVNLLHSVRLSGIFSFIINSSYVAIYSLFSRVYKQVFFDNFSLDNLLHKQEKVRSL